MPPCTARAWPLLLITPLLLSVGCADADAPSEPTPDSGRDLDAFVPPDRDAMLDRGMSNDSGAPLGLFLDPCQDNGECESGFCIPNEEEERNICSQRCLQNTQCPGGWSCRIVENTPPDVVSICFPRQSRVCGVCVDDRDCPGGHCYPLDGTTVCGFDCATDDDCTTGYRCGDVGGRMTCTPSTNSCSCNEENAGDQRLCQRQNEFGGCIGRETCDATEGWIGCDAQEPSAEICNQVDDDCNGFTDDIVGLGEVCERSVDVGGETIACSGRLVCTLEQPEPVCTAPAPMAELCNFLDDDSDGSTDEGFDTRGQVCIVGEGSCRRVGVNACSGDGAEVNCDVVPGDPTDEQCNALDDDCDGQIDEAFIGLNEPCFAGEGACRRAGALRCAADGGDAVCTAVAGVPVDETCDGIDNDCDGNADEGFGGLFDPCAVGVGACLRQGFLYCTDDGAEVACNAAAAQPSVETCNGIDDDCDGTADEGFAGVNRPCAVGIGSCRGAGVTVCSPDGAQVVCNAELSPAGDETCNGLDDDCDGTTDEAFPGLATACSVGVGVCVRSGVRRCSDDAASVVCDALPGAPGQETCNRLDDDCDGRIDEDYPGVGTACTAGNGICLASGVRQCSADGAAVVCDAVPGVPGAEGCNGLDDDCDGTADEGFAGVNRPCQAGIGQCREAGVTVCSADGAAVVCNAVAGVAGAESCNGLDDDCDGRLDETFPTIGTACNAGVGACLRSGVRQCGADGASVVCDAVAGPIAVESCNGLDDDCDARLDEAFPGVGTACSAGVGVCVRPGVRRCSGDGAAVVCDAQPGNAGVEICNGLDDDCDGTTDEGFAGLNTGCSAGVGLCARPGVRVCSADGAAVICNAQAAPPAAETCDAQDNDCDGRSDETFAALGQLCSAGQGACLRQGVQICAPGGAAVICNAAAGNPGVDICNGLDDDCDGRADEQYADLNRACTVGDGVCRRVGVRVCSADGAQTICNEAPGAPAAESCNALDDDCDTRTDEAFAALGQRCEVGLGLCRRSGVQICTVNGQGVLCDATPGPAAPTETCDYQDDNCNGSVDEGFVDGQGRYIQVANCGACGNNCNALWNPNPAAFGVTATCGVQGAAAQCGYQCLPGFIDADGRANNGCELQADPQAVYVATPQDGGVAAADCGDLLRPCSTLNAGLGRVVALNRLRVRVAEGVYRESITLPNGKSILGGHDPVSWVREPEFNVTILNGNTLAGTDRRTVSALNINQPTVFEGFVVNGESPLVDGSAYAVYIRDSNNSLTIRNNRIFAGDGGRGADGTSGGSGVPGTNGTQGRASFGAFDPSPCGPNNGGNGGARMCGATNVGGGRGGNAGCPANNRQEGSGLAGGGGAVAGAGGAGAFGFTAPNENTCTVSDAGPPDPGTGAAGRAGADGTGGVGAPAGLGNAGVDWRGSSGATGVTGQPGGGGGGGGAAAGVDVDWAQAFFTVAHDIGASGGGGGSGGCQGNAGTGGTAGGGSFGIYVIFTGTGPANAAGFPVLTGNEVARGLGGNGGAGGVGGGGGEGGLGGGGGIRGPEASLWMPFCSFTGGDGAPGGRGGHGGGGGGGQGGISYDIFVANDNNLTPADYTGQNVFVFGAGDATFGRGGGGGNSSNTVLGLGTAGANGQSGNVGRVP